MSDSYELRCKECGKTWGNSPRSFCEDCFSPLEVSFDYDAIKKTRSPRRSGFPQFQHVALFRIPARARKFSAAQRCRRHAAGGLAQSSGAPSSA